MQVLHYAKNTSTLNTEGRLKIIIVMFKFSDILQESRRLSNW